LNPRIILGSANFGTPYGLKNNGINEVSKTDLEIISENMKKFNISEIDTAADYEGSHKVLGTYFSKNEEISYFTKFGLRSYSNVTSFEKVVNESLYLLKRDKLQGIALRDFTKADSEIQVKTLKFLQNLKEKGVLSSFGITVYDLQELNKLNKVLFSFDYIQVPENIADRRLIDHPLMMDIMSKGIEIQVRTIFLQGLLIKPINEIPFKFREANKVFESLNELASNRRESMLQLAVNYASNIKWCTGIVVGISSFNDLVDIVGAMKKSRRLEAHDLPVTPSWILDPRKW
jgi:aryl-alcohol dehydrogenase-like predicted oxidoreductase